MKLVYECRKCWQSRPCVITFTNHKGVMVEVHSTVLKTCISRLIDQPNQRANFVLRGSCFPTTTPTTTTTEYDPDRTHSLTGGR